MPSFARTDLPDGASSVDPTTWGGGGGPGAVVEAFWSDQGSDTLNAILTIEYVEATFTRTPASTPATSVLWGSALTSNDATALGDSGDPDLVGTWSLESGTGTLTQTTDWTHKLEGAAEGEPQTIRWTPDDPEAALDLLKLASWLRPVWWIGIHSGSPDRVDEVWLATAVTFYVTVEQSQVWLQKRYFPGKRR